MTVPISSSAVQPTANASDRGFDIAGDRHAALGGFARKLSHDLNNFATVMRTYSELVLADLPTSNPTHADVAEVHRAANAMVTYVQRISRFARAASIRLQPHVLGLLVDDAINASGVNELAPVRVAIADDARRATVHTDATWSIDVLRELLQNAREASPLGASVTLTADVRRVESDELHGGQLVRAGRWATVAVVDSGPGFAASVNATAEEPFVTTKEGARGAGFGLTVASALARAQHGVLTRERIDATTVVALWYPLGDD
jgi:signal transduction histidine kinase